MPDQVQRPIEELPAAGVDLRPATEQYLPALVAAATEFSDFLVTALRDNGGRARRSSFS